MNQKTKRKGEQEDEKGTKRETNSSKRDGKRTGDEHNGNAVRGAEGRRARADACERDQPYHRADQAGIAYRHHRDRQAPDRGEVLGETRRVGQLACRACELLPALSEQLHEDLQGVRGYRVGGKIAIDCESERDTGSCDVRSASRGARAFRRAERGRQNVDQAAQGRGGQGKRGAGSREVVHKGSLGAVQEEARGGDCALQADDPIGGKQARRDRGSVESRAQAP